MSIGLKETSCIYKFIIVIFVVLEVYAFSMIEPYMHLSADNGVFVNENGFSCSDFEGVGFWQDISGNSNDGIQGDLDKRPIYISNVVNGKPILRFDGLDDFFKVNFSESISQPNIFFLVLNTRSIKNECIFDGDSMSNRQYFSVGSDSRHFNWMYGVSKATFSTLIENGKFALHSIVFNGYDSKHYINGILQNVSNVGEGQLNGLIIGGRYNYSNYNEFDLAELVIYRGLMNDSHKSSVETYLMNKYAIQKKCGDYNVGFPVADFNQDCFVDFNDYVFFAEQWLSDTSLQSANHSKYITARPQNVDVFWQGMENIHTYRTPSIITTNNGVLLAFAGARKYSIFDKRPTSIVLRRSYNNGQSWLPVQILYDPGEDAAMSNTSLIDRITGRAWIFFTIYPQGWDSNIVPGLKYPSVTLKAMYSDDDGVNWSGPIDITSQVKLPEWNSYNVGPGIGIQLQRWPYQGRLVVPGGHSGGDNTNHTFYSDNHGLTWNLSSGSIPGRSSEIQIIELYDGALLANIRSGGIRGRRISKSYNFGASWSPIINDSVLIEPICQASILRYTSIHQHDKNRILFCNPASSVERQNLTVRLSYDECESWTYSKIICNTLAGYSCMTILDDMRIGCLYENGDSYSAERITFTSFSLEWLTDDMDSVPYTYRTLN